MVCIFFHDFVSTPLAGLSPLRPQAICTVYCLVWFCLSWAVLRRGQKWRNPYEQAQGNGLIYIYPSNFFYFSDGVRWVKWILLSLFNTKVLVLGHIFNINGIKLLITKNLLGFEFRETFRQSLSITEDHNFNLAIWAS